MSRWATRFRRRQYLKRQPVGAPVVRLHYWCIARTTVAMDRPHGAHQDADALFARHRYRRAHSIIGALVALLGFVVTIGVLVIQ